MSWLDRFFLGGYGKIQIGGVDLPPEAVINFPAAVTGADDAANGRTNITTIQALVAHGAAGTTETFDFTAGPNHSVTFDNNVTITFTAPAVERHCTIEFIYSGGGHTLTWPATVKWAGGVQPTWDTTGNKNVATFFWDGAAYLAMGNSFL
jgi:hypothetical protein